MKRTILTGWAALLALFAGLLFGAPTASADTGSDTNYGYRYLDSDESNGPVYDRLIPGNSANFTNNAQTRTLNIGFTFEYYGANYTQVTVTEDGVAVMGGGQSDPTENNADLDNVNRRLIAPLWDDWDVDNALSQVYYQTFGASPNRVFVVEWRIVNANGAPGDTVTFQMKLGQSDDSVEFHYTDVLTADAGQTQGGSATIGIDNWNNSNLQYSYNTASVRNSFAIRFFQPVCAGLKATMVGTPGPDVLVGTPGNDVIVGLGGHDRLLGNLGNDVLCGNTGDDELRGGVGSDRVFGQAGDDELWGGDGNDLLLGQNGNDTINGVGGFDVIRGGAGDDVIDSGADPDNVFGDGGNDVINGGGGDDILRGQGGSDVIRGGAGNDVIDTGPGNDVGGTGGSGDDTIKGGPGNDVLNGGFGDDTVRGNNGNDTLRGAQGDDLLVGAGGNDTLLGAAGADRHVGGAGNDLCNGGADGGVPDTAVGCETRINIP